MTSVTSGLPRVRVPVLSSATTRIRASSSTWIPPLIRTPRRAPVPSAATSVIGTEMTSAHGAAATTRMVAMRAAPLQANPATSGSMVATRTPAASTSGLYHRPKRSMKRWLVPLRSCASSTSPMMRDSVFSANGFVARTSSAPERLIVPASTRSPCCFSTGTLSPVTGDSSSADWPDTITPSVGTDPPGLSRNTSPGTTSSAAISTSAPSRRTVAVCGASFIKARTADRVRSAV